MSDIVLPPVPIELEDNAAFRLFLQRLRTKTDEVNTELAALTARVEALEP